MDTFFFVFEGSLIYVISQKSTNIENILGSFLNSFHKAGLSMANGGSIKIKKKLIK